ncbi:MAG: fimbria/pilus outer membrane usher protein, partial [Hafnia sp.]
MRYPVFKIVVAVTGLLFLDECCASSEFNNAFLKGAEKDSLPILIDPESGILPGIYPLDVYLNGRHIEQREVSFTSRHGSGSVQPCLTRELLHSLAVNIGQEEGLECISLPDVIPGATVSSTIPEHRLDIFVPQMHLSTRPRDAIPVNLYDEGITAGFLNYNLAASQTNNLGQHDQYAFLNLRSGFNVGSWRLRNTVSVNKADGGSPHWQNPATWLETALPNYTSRLVLGQTSTADKVYESIPFRGLQITSEDMMRAESQSRYAPAIRGVAATNARVEVRQNKYLIYATNVPPGPFEFRDIIPASQSGDLYVTVTEADGRVQNMVVPFTSLPGMVRKGLWNYEAVAGRYHDGADGYAPGFTQIQAATGLTDTLTLSGGLLAAEHYQSLAIAVARNFGDIGALQLDFSASDSHLASGDEKRGGSMRFLYAKSFSGTGTRLQLAGYRYSSSGFYDFTESVQERRRWEDGRYKNYYWDNDRERDADDFSTTSVISYSPNFSTKKARLSLSLNQQTGDTGQAYLTLNRQSYWQNSDTEMSIQSGYSSRWGKVSYSLFYQRTRNNYYSGDDSVNFRFTLPLTLGQQSATASVDVHATSKGKPASSLGLSGTLMDKSNLSYNVQSSYEKSVGQGQNMSLGYNSHAGNFYVGYSGAPDMRQFSMNAAGSVVAHGGGITFAPPLGNTFSLAHAPDARGTGISNQQGSL